VSALFDLEPEQQGKREEHVEWGLRYPAGAYLAPTGGVEKRPSEENARGNVDQLYRGTAGTVVVRRTVVTYTTDWEEAP